METFEKVEGFWTVKDGQYCQDIIPDDQALAINIAGQRACRHHRLCSLRNHQYHQARPEDHGCRGALCRDRRLSPHGMRMKGA